MFVCCLDANGEAARTSSKSPCSGMLSLALLGYKRSTWMPIVPIFSLVAARSASDALQACSRG